MGRAQHNVWHELILYIFLLAIRAMLVFKSLIFSHLPHPSKPRTMLVMIIATAKTH